MKLVAADPALTQSFFYWGVVYLAGTMLAGCPSRIAIYPSPSLSTRVDCADRPGGGRAPLAQPSFCVRMRACGGHERRVRHSGITWSALSRTSYLQEVLYVS